MKVQRVRCLMSRTLRFAHGLIYIRGSSSLRSPHPPSSMVDLENWSLVAIQPITFNVYEMSLY